MIKEITAGQITQAVKAIFLQAGLVPPKEVIDTLAEKAKTESAPQGREILEQLVENARIACETGIPYCQDTGMAVLFCDIGQDVHISGDFTAAVNEGVRQAYEEGYFRKSVLSPLQRKNTGDNTPAIIHTRLVPGSTLKLTAAPKGFGSENMSRIAMLKPSAGIQGVVDFLVESMQLAGGNPCPPVVLGVGIGGTFEYAALMAKRQLLRPLGQPAQDPQLAELEQEVLKRINALGMGPMGIGGDNYCLAVHMESYPTHLAGLPVAVNVCCHALRHASIEL